MNLRLYSQWKKSTTAGPRIPVAICHCIFYNDQNMEKEVLNNLSLILVEPKEPGNIGAAVRAMKNMGLSRLRLVNPVPYRDVPEQKKMGYRSQDIIRSAEEYPSLAAAVKDLNVVFLATVRKGKWKKDFLSPEDAADLIGRQIRDQQIGLVFGREDKGVTIDESQLANYFIRIPAAVSYPSLNLSQAVMVTLYQVYSRIIVTPAAAPKLPPLAPRSDFDRLSSNIWQLMKSLRFREREKGLFHRSLLRALNRTRWSSADIAVFDRFCKQVRWYRDNHPPGSDQEV
jgi:TrmH family RNA methyltransferase